MNGQIKFDNPVNFTHLSQENNFFDMFDIGWFSEEDEYQTVPYKWLNVTVDHFDDDNMTVNFTVYGEVDEILIGSILFKLNPDFDVSEIYLTDQNKTEILNSEARQSFTYVQLTL